MLIVTRVIFVVFLAKTTPCCKRPAGKPNYPRFGFEALNLLRTLLRKGRRVAARGEGVGWLLEDFIGFYTSFFKGLNGPREKRESEGTGQLMCTATRCRVRPEKLSIFSSCKENRGNATFLEISKVYSFLGSHLSESREAFPVGP